MTFSASHIRFWENVPSCPDWILSKGVQLSHSLNGRKEEYLIRFTLIVPDQGRIPILAKISSLHTHDTSRGHDGVRSHTIIWNGRLAVDCALAYGMSIPFWQFEVVFDEDTRKCEITMKDDDAAGFLNLAFQHIDSCNLCKQKLLELDHESRSRGA